MAPRIKMIVIYNLLGSEFAKTNERRFGKLAPSKLKITNT